jgi:FtsZ-interacting cell division protein ZipA
MEAIINFIKEALEGKKMSASWIVTIAIAIGGLVFSGMLALQKYEAVMVDIEELKKASHEKTPIYNYTFDDTALEAITRVNSGAIISLSEKIKALRKDQDRVDTKVNSTGNPLSL